MTLPGEEGAREARTLLFSCYSMREREVLFVWKIEVGINAALGYQLLLINHKNWNKSLPGLAWRLV